MKKLFLFIIVIAAVIAAGCTGPSTSSGRLTTPVTTVAPSVHIPYGQDYKTTLDAPATKEVYLNMVARIQSKDLQGGRPYMTIMVNGKEITGERLVNKNLNFTYGNGRARSYYNQDNSSAWYLFMSPDFISNNAPGSDHYVPGNNAYVYRFDVSSLVNQGSPNEVILHNNADLLVNQYTDPTQIEVFKSSDIIVDSLILEGKGSNLVEVTKVAAPVRIVTGKTSTVTLTLTNKLAGNITDISITDDALPSGMNGQPFSGKVDTPIPSGGTYSVKYDVSADRQGTYKLGGVSVTFADPTGNYQKIYSSGVTIEVL